MKLSREIKTGVIVVGGILLFIMGFSYLKSTPLFDNSKTFYGIYENVGGLQTGTSVSINGLNVGSVNDIKFHDKSGKLLVTFSVNNEFEFSNSSMAELYDTGIIGGKGIQIIPVFDGNPKAKSGDTLITGVKPGLTDLVQKNLAPLQQKIEGAVTHADSLLVSFNQILDTKTKTDLRETVTGLNALVKSFQSTSNAMNTLIADNRVQLNGSVKNIGLITDNFAKLSDSLSNAGLTTTIKTLETTLANFNQILSKMEQGEGTMGKLMTDDELYRNLTSSSNELDLLLQDFRLNPKRYVNVSVFGKKQIEYELPENDPALNIEE
ncbi:MAG: MlaD family protein [Cellulophaga sp.]|nr:MlaD family protein [Cellulophaga sp.]